MSLLRAIYLNGKVLTGITHADAYSNLSADEKQQANNIISGFLNKQTGEFLDIDNDAKFYTKETLLVRHGSISDPEDPDPQLSEDGVNEIEKIAYYLRNYVNLKGCQAIVSPSLRCIQTAEIIAYHTRLRFSVKLEIQEAETVDTLKNVMDNMSEKTLIISHSPIIQGLVRLAVGQMVDNPIPTGSLTIINKRHTVCMGFKY